MTRTLLLIPVLLVSCLPRLSSKGELKFEEKFFKTTTETRSDEQAEFDYFDELRKEKIKDYQELETVARESFTPLFKIFERKCFDCHDSTRKLPLYGRVLPRINPVKKHQVEGLRALDMKNIYPFETTEGEVSQLALLKAIKSATLDKSMPLKSYVLVYPFRRISKKDKVKILNWVEPLIEEHERLREKYRPLTQAQSIEQRVSRLFFNKCLRCHGNGNRRGGFGGMEDLQKLASQTRYINKENPEESLLFTISKSGEMPTDPRERLTQQELDLLSEWLSTLSQQ